MGLFRTVSEINGDLSLKSQNFPTPVYFAPQLKGLRLQFGIGSAKGQKTRVMALLDGQESFIISFSVWTQYRSVTDRQTDRQPSFDGKDRASIASRGQKVADRSQSYLRGRVALDQGEVD